MAKRLKRIIFLILYIGVFSFIYSISISLFLNPNSLAPGGISGIAIMLNHLVKLPVGLAIFAFNIPLLILAFVKLGKPLFYKTLLTIAFTTVFIDFLADTNKFPVPTNNPILAAIYGGLLLALSLAFLLKVGATTGGVDIVIRLIKLRLPHMETGKLFLILDTTVVALSAIVFRSIETALYAAITIFISSFFLDRLLYGTDKKILMFIISNKADEITNSLLYNIETGVTHIKGVGAYDGNDKKIIMCAFKKQKYPKVEKLIFEIDKDSFIIITSANEILGKGYRSFDDERL